MGSWRKFHNEELHNLYSSPNKTRIIKSRRVRSAGNITRMGTREFRKEFGGNDNKETTMGTYMLVGR
jgi:hypothetical protein